MLVAFLVTVFGGLLSEAAGDWMGEYDDAHICLCLSLSPYLYVSLCVYLSLFVCLSV